ncbi:hypothetical protein CYMTET_44945, partial [Cymbomonas tetramitiformis]
MAVDDLDGALDSLVLACSPDGVANRFERRGVAGCAIAGGTPGVYSVIFSVANSAGIVATATRLVTVVASCPLGENPCADLVTCSMDGVCLGDLTRNASATVAVGASPSIALRTSAAMPSAYVEVRQHSEYRACVGTEAEHADVLCEPGAEAADDEDGNLTAQVLVCLPPECEGRVACAGHEWVSKGVQGCVNTSSAVETVFDVVFQVYDSSQPAQAANVTRYVVIIDPCASGEELCEDLTCSSISCATRDGWAVDPVDITPPVVTLLQPSPARVVYGDAAKVAELQPCSSTAEYGRLAPCAASAQDDVDMDVSGSLTAVQHTACAGCSTTGCPLAELHLCFPGTYGFRFEAQDSSGNIGVALLMVTLVEVATVSAQIVVSAGTDSQAEAEAYAALLLQEDSPEATAFSQGIADLLNSDESATGGVVLTADSIAINAVTVQEADPEATGVDLSLVVSFNTTVASAEPSSGVGRRRLLDLSTQTNGAVALLTAATGDGRMSESLGQAALKANTSLPTAVTGLADNVSSRLTSWEGWSPQRLTSWEGGAPEADELGGVEPPEADELGGVEPLQVDEMRAYESSISGTMGTLQLNSARLSADLTEGVLPSVEAATGDADDWTEKQLSTWLDGQREDFANLDLLLDTTQELKRRLELFVQAQALVKAGLLDAELRLQETMHHMEETLASSQQAIAAAVALQEVTAAPEAYSKEGCGLEKLSFQGSVQNNLEMQYAFLVGGGVNDTLVAGDAAPSELQRRRLSQLHSENYRRYIEYNWWKLPTVPEVDELTRTSPFTKPARHMLAGRHALVGGILSYIKRSKEDARWPCTSRFENIQAPCFTQPLGEGYYGRAPVFYPGTSPGTSFHSPPLPPPPRSMHLICFCEPQTAISRPPSRQSRSRAPPEASTHAELQRRGEEASAPWSGGHAEESGRPTRGLPTRASCHCKLAASRHLSATPLASSQHLATCP